MGSARLPTGQTLLFLLLSLRGRAPFRAPKGGGEIFNASNPPVFVYDDNGSGTLDIYSFYMGSDKIKSGTGDIALIVFNTKIPGDGTIDVTSESELLDENGQLIPIQSFGSGVISAQ